MHSTRTSAGISPGFRLPTREVDVNAVTHVDGDLGQVLVGAVHGVSELQGGDLFPASLIEDLAGFGRALIHFFVFDRIFAFAQNP